MQSYYKAEKLNSHITAIRSMTGEILYLIEGEKQAVLIDTCVGVGHLKKYVRNLTAKPIKVLLTHGHIDHAMGAPEFEDVYMNMADKNIFRSQRSIKNRKEYIAALLGGKLPDFLNDKDFVPESEPDFHNLSDGDIFDLGGIHIEVYALPGHTPGSMVMLIPEENTLILGDACNNATFLFDEHSLSISKYRENLIKVYERLKGKFNNVLLCHYVMKAKPDIMVNVINVCDEIMEGKADNVPFSFMGQKAYIAKKCNKQFERYDGKEGNIVYSE